MSSIRFSNQFKRRYKQRIAKDQRLKRDFQEALTTFQTDRKSPAIGDHQLRKSMYQYRAFSINSSIRVVYLEKPDHILFIDIGTHQEVYRK